VNKELKPCPFCGKKVAKYIEDTLPNGHPVCYVECQYCLARSQPFVVNYTPDMVKREWNKRV